jgi:hypothetical protein
MATESGHGFLFAAQERKPHDYDQRRNPKQYSAIHPRLLQRPRFVYLANGTVNNNFALERERRRYTARIELFQRSPVKQEERLDRSTRQNLTTAAIRKVYRVELPSYHSVLACQPANSPNRQLWREISRLEGGALKLSKAAQMTRLSPFSRKKEAHVKAGLCDLRARYDRIAQFLAKKLLEAGLAGRDLEWVLSGRGLLRRRS